MVPHREHNETFEINVSQQTDEPLSVMNYDSIKPQLKSRGRAQLVAIIVLVFLAIAMIPDSREKLRSFLGEWIPLPIKEDLPTTSTIFEYELNHGGPLIVAELRTDHTWKKETWYQIWGKKVPGTTSITRIKLPVIYRFVIQAEEISLFRVEYSDGRSAIDAIAPVPTLLPTVAFDTRTVMTKIESGIFRGNADLVKLERELSAHLESIGEQKAGTPEVRSIARESIANHFTDLLLKLGVTSNIGTVNVMFEDEPESRAYTMRVGVKPAPLP